jgi:hypothetical protein
VDPGKYQKLALKMQGAYRDTNPHNIYHNSTHAADVLQAVYYYLYNAGV